MNRLASILLCACICRAAITDAQAIAIINGEAIGEPYAGKVAVAAVLRRRDSVKGFCGLHNPQVAKATEAQRQLALKAWRESATNDPSLGATHFESTDFKRPEWAKSMTVTTNIGKHIFYK